MSEAVKVDEKEPNEAPCGCANCRLERAILSEFQIEGHEGKVQTMPLLEAIGATVGKLLADVEPIYAHGWMLALAHDVGVRRALSHVQQSEDGEEPAPTVSNVGHA